MQEPLLDEIDQAVEIIRNRYSMALQAVGRAQVVVHTCEGSLYAALRRRQAVRVAAEVEAPVPCRDCLNDIPVSSGTGAGGYTSGAVHHELIYESGELPYATCDRPRA